MINSSKLFVIAEADMLNDKDTAIIIQARMSSRRFPGKMLSVLAGKPLIKFVYERCQQSSVKKILVATSRDPSDDVLVEYCRRDGMQLVRGSLDNVLQRYIDAAEYLGCQNIVRVCGDTPLVDTSLIDRAMQTLCDEKLEYVSYDRESCASGFYSEAVTLNALKKIAREATEKEDFEHVTRFIVKHKADFLTAFIRINLNPEIVRNRRLTIDCPKDLGLVNSLVNALPDPLQFTSQEILTLLNKIMITQDEQRN